MNFEILRRMFQSKSSRRMSAGLSEDACCIIRDLRFPKRLLVTLSGRHRDDALILIESAIEEARGDAETNIEFAALPSEEYLSFLLHSNNANDSMLCRAEYIFETAENARQKNWEESGRNFSDASFLLMFQVKTPYDMADGQEYITQYRLQQEDCRRITNILSGIYPDSIIYVSREVIHWGDYFQDPDRYYRDALSAIEGGGRCYMGSDLIQCYGTKADARFLAPILTLPVVIRRPLPRVMRVPDCERYLDDAIRHFDMHSAREITSSILASEIEICQLFDPLLTPSIAYQVLSKILQEKGVTFNVIKTS